jgi:sulfofructose kinase
VRTGCSGEKFHYARAYWIETVDTTGAGDLFHAGFMYGLLQGWSMQKQLEFACAAAALNCRGVGARGGIEAVDIIHRLIKTGARHTAAYELGETS